MPEHRDPALASPAAPLSGPASGPGTAAEPARVPGSPSGSSSGAGPQSRPAPPPMRIPSLDALRGGALLLGVLLHAVMPFLPGVPWLVTDSRSSDAALVVVYVLHLFRMVLFMLLAGYFGRMVLNRRGAGAYLRDRATRIGLPLVGFWPIVAGLTVLALVTNQLLRGAGPLTQPPAPEGSGGDAEAGILALPTFHLWFLLLLLEIVLVTVAARAILVRIIGAHRAEKLISRAGGLLSSPAGVLIAAVPYALGVMAQGTMAGGIVEPRTLMPVAGASIAYTGAFLIGWALHARPEALRRLQRQWPAHLTCAVLLSILEFLGQHLVPLPVAAIVTAVAAWTWVYALLGLGGRVLDREIPAVRYLADASYWIYLMHLPLLLLVEVPLADLALPVIVKLTIALVIVVGVLLVSYDLFVRSTWLGAWLNGRRRPRALFARSQARSTSISLHQPR
ncbi:acyltransferase family protein [Brachybacterium sp. GCM10030252]|uniref:acyltransferase family protein n=1 Tax=Brachybacterium sp. GCM10030252 TaxID=3273380 RepID=UPI003618B020